MIELLRTALVEAARESVELGLNYGTTGNLSVRAEGGCLITPSGLALDRLDEDDLVHLAMDGTVREGRHAPSSEWRLHRDLYLERPDAGGVVHAHPRFATTLACLRRELPAVHYLIAAAGGGDVRCAPYATFGTEALSQVARRALEGRKACLLANHGLLALGADVWEGLRVAREVETVAEYYWRALQVGQPAILSADEMAEVLARFTTYGRPG